MLFFFVLFLSSLFFIHALPSTKLESAIHHSINELLNEETGPMLWPSITESLMKDYINKKINYGKIGITVTDPLLQSLSVSDRNQISFSKETIGETNKILLKVADINFNFKMHVKASLGPLALGSMLHASTSTLHWSLLFTQTPDKLTLSNSEIDFGPSFQIQFHGAGIVFDRVKGGIESWFNSFVREQIENSMVYIFEEMVTSKMVGRRHKYSKGDAEMESEQNRESAASSTNAQLQSFTITDEEFSDGEEEA